MNRKRRGPLLAGRVLGNEVGSGRPSYIPPPEHCQDILARIAAAMKRRDVFEAHKLRHIAALEFARLNEWELTARCFTPEEIFTDHWGSMPPQWPFDHPLFFRKDGINIAIAGQPYVDSHTGAYFALQLEMPRRYLASIYHPGPCGFVVLRPDGHKMKWLPEQR